MRIDVVHQIPPIPFLTPEEEDYWVEQFAIQGFDNCRSLASRAGARVDNFRISFQLCISIPMAYVSRPSSRCEDADACVEQNCILGVRASAGQPHHPGAQPLDPPD